MCELFLPNRLHYSHMELLLVKLGVGKKSPFARSALPYRIGSTFVSVDFGLPIDC